MQDDQEHIYYLGGDSLDAVRNSPHLESFARKDIEVLFFADPIDEFWLGREVRYQDKTFVSVSKGEIDLSADDADADTDDKMDRPQLDGLLQTIRTHLQDHIKDVRLSGRLTDSPACLVGDKDDLSPQLEQMMRQLGQDPPKTKRILEVNPNHPFITELAAIYLENAQSSRLKTYAQLLHGQAILAEGGTLPDPSAYSQIVMEVASQALTANKS